MKLEHFIRENRGAFDDKTPSEKLWQRISSKLTSSSSPGRDFKWLWRAAAIFFFATTLALTTKLLSDKNTNSQMALTEFAEAEKFYTRQITDKIRLIDTFQKTDGLNGYTQDFQQLEAMYLVLKEEMNTRPSKKVSDALILNLLVRINLLNQQLKRLEDKAGKKQSAT